MNKKLFFLIGLVISLMALLFALQIYSIFSSPKKNLLLSPNQVEGSAVIYKEQPFTLNFEQQVTVLQAVNNASLLEEQNFSAINKTLPLWSKISIYLFNKEVVDIIPLGYFNKHLIYSIEQKIYQDSEENSFEEIVSKAFDIT